MKKYDIDSSTSTAENTENEVAEKQATEKKSEAPKKSTTPKRSTTPSQRRQTVQQDDEEPVQSTNVFKQEAEALKEQVGGGLVDAWNSTEPEEIEEFDAKAMVRALILPTILVIIYYIFPIDIVPDEIPVVGTMDDFAVGQLLLVSGFRKKYQKITGQDLDIKQVMSGRNTILKLLEHLLTSIIQIIPEACGEVFISPIILATVDLVVTLMMFYKAAFRNVPGGVKSVFKKNKSKQKKAKKKKLLKGDALKK